MQERLSLAALAVLLSACAPTPPVTGAPVTVSVTASPAFNLSRAQKLRIGQKIWQNESGGKISGLTAWNQGEEFPSLGIGHFIWYPQHFRGPYTESWPSFVKFASQRGNQAPPIAHQAHCPWKTRASFLQQQNSPTMRGLRNWLASNIELQTDFIIYKSKAALPKILQAAPASQRARIQANYNKVASTANGTYALIDYVNFKGEGTNPSERYQGQGWGLMWVLQEMQNVSNGQAAAQEFAAAAKRRLATRIKNAPPARGEARWKAGWFNRCDGYARPL